MKVNVGDNGLVMAVLNGLASSYKQLIVALDAVRDEDRLFKFKFLKFRLFKKNNGLKCVKPKKERTPKHL